MASTKKVHTPSVICTKPKVPMRQSKLMRKTEVGFFYENLPQIVHFEFKVYTLPVHGFKWQKN